jgi:hypothetical protein
MPARYAAEHAASASPRLLLDTDLTFVIAPSGSFSDKTACACKI